MITALDFFAYFLHPRLPRTNQMVGQEGRKYEDTTGSAGSLTYRVLNKLASKKLQRSEEISNNKRSRHPELDSGSISIEFLRSKNTCLLAGIQDDLFTNI